MIVRAASLANPDGWHFDIGSASPAAAKRGIRRSHNLPPEVEWAAAPTIGDLQRSEMPDHYRDHMIVRTSLDPDAVRGATTRMDERAKRWAVS